jgi:ketosteroid isomerase-like protein
VSAPPESNKDAMRRVLKAYSEGDIEPVVALLHSDIVWTSQSPKALFRFGGRHEGKDAALLGIAMISAEYQTHHYDVIELVGEGDVVWMNALLDMTSRRNSARFRLSIASRWQFRDGMVIALTEYYDLASVALMEGRAIPAPD